MKMKMEMKSYWLTWCMKNMLGLKFERMDLQLFLGCCVMY